MNHQNPTPQIDYDQPMPRNLALTKRLISAGYRRSCERRGLDPHDLSWTQQRSKNRNNQ